MAEWVRTALMFGVVTNVVLGLAAGIALGFEKSAFNFGLALIILALNPELTRHG